MRPIRLIALFLLALPGCFGSPHRAHAQTAYQTCAFSDPTRCYGIGPGAAGQAYVSNGPSAYPAFSSSLPGVTSVGGVTIPATASEFVTAPTTTTASFCLLSTSTAGLGSWGNCPGGSMVYPAAGIPQSTGSAWGTSITPGTGVVTALGVSVGSAGAVVVNGGALGTPSSGVGTNLTGTAAGLNIGGTAANLSGTPSLPNGTTATTQTTGDSSTKLATDAFVLANASSSGVSSAAAGGGIVISGTGSGPYTGAITIGTTVPQRTVTTSPTVVSTDMGGVIFMNVSGGGSLTIPAIGSGVFGSGQSLSVVNYSASTATVSATPAVNAGGGCVTGTGIPAGAQWQMVSNGTSIDCIQTVSSASGGSSAFSSLTTGENNSATMTVGPSAIFGILGSSGTGYTNLASANTSSTNYTATLPANTGTILENNAIGTITVRPTFSAGILNTAGNAASYSVDEITGPPYAAGTSTTNWPGLYYNCNGSTAPTTLSANGTYTGGNTCSGFTGNLIDWHVNGGPGVYSVNYQGNVLAGTYNGVTIPSATDTAALLATTQTLTNKSIAASEVNSGTLAAAQMPALTGDVTSTAGSVATTVAKVNGVTVGSTTLTSGTTITPNCSYHTNYIVASATGVLTVAAPTGCTPYDGQKLLLKVKIATGGNTYSASAIIAGANLAWPSTAGTAGDEDHFMLIYDATLTTPGWVLEAYNLSVP